MRLLRALLLLAVAGALLGGCASNPACWPMTEQPLNPTLKPYKHLYVGWISLPEEDWQTYGYPTKEEWVTQIRAFNTTGIQQYVKEWMPQMQVSGAQAEDQGLPTEGELYLKFKYLRLVQRYDAWTGMPDEMSLEVEFIDLATKETVYKSSMVATSQGSWGPRNWKCNSFDGRLDNTMYNLAGWLKERLKA